MLASGAGDLHVGNQAIGHGAGNQEAATGVQISKTGVLVRRPIGENVKVRLVALEKHVGQGAGHNGIVLRSATAERKHGIRGRMVDDRRIEVRQYLSGIISDGGG